MLNVQADTLHRVMACNGSVSMGGNEPPIDQLQSDDALEGQAAHFVAGSVLSGQHSDPVEWVERRTPQGVYVTPDMAEYVETYVAEVLARSKFHPPERHVDHTIDFSLTPDIAIHGRVDCAAYHKDIDTLFIDDLRYGWRVVEPFENWSMIAKAIGYLSEINVQPGKIVFTIFQPRPFHVEGPVRTWTIDFRRLQLFQARMTTTLAALSNGLLTGPHCRNCSALARCSAARMAGMNAIDATGQAFTEDIPDAALSFELDNLSRAAEAIELRFNALKDLAKHRIKSGAVIENYSVEPSYGNRVWNEGLTADVLSAMTGGKVNFNAPPKIITPAQAEKAGVSEDVVKALAKRPFTGERLTRIKASAKAAKLFKQTEGN